MITNYYNASNHFSAPIRKEPKPFLPQNLENRPQNKVEKMDNRKNIWNFAEMDQDVLILLGLILLLLYSGCTDKLLLIALLYIIIS